MPACYSLPPDGRAPSSTAGEHCKSRGSFTPETRLYEWWQQRFWEMEIPKGFFFCMRCELY